MTNVILLHGNLQAPAAAGSTGGRRGEQRRLFAIDKNCGSRAGCAALALASAGALESDPAVVASIRTGIENGSVRNGDELRGAAEDLKMGAEAARGG